MSGFHPKRGSPKEILHAIISDLKEAAIDRDWARFEIRADELRSHVGAFLEVPGQLQWHKTDLSATEARLAHLLHSKIGKAVPKSTIMDCLYFDNPGDEPDAKIVDVYISKIRTKLKKNNFPYHIKTVWGVGYEMVEGADPIQNRKSRWNHSELRRVA